MPCDIWFLGVGIYFGCTIWLRRWDFSLPSHSLRTVRVSSAVASGTRLGILALCGVSRRKNDTQSFLLARRLFARPRSARGRITSKVVCAHVTSEAKRKADAMHLLFFFGTSHRKRYRFLWKRNRYLGGVCHGWLFPLLHFANDFPVGGQQFDPCVIESQQ